MELSGRFLLAQGWEHVYLGLNEFQNAFFLTKWFNPKFAQKLKLFKLN